MVTKQGTHYNELSVSFNFELDTLRRRRNPLDYIGFFVFYAKKSAYRYDTLLF